MRCKDTLFSAKNKKNARESLFLAIIECFPPENLDIWNNIRNFALDCTIIRF